MTDVQGNVSVNKAIWRGILTITLPVAIINLIIFIGAMYMASHVNDRSIFTLGLLAGMLITLPYLSIVGTNWYIWAFSHVRNIHELEQKAIFAGLILHKNKISRISIFLSKEKQEKIKTIKERLYTDDTFEDDTAIPNETKIYAAKVPSAFRLLVMLVLFVVGIVLIFIAHLVLGGIILCAISGYFIYGSYEVVINRDPQLILNNKGIETPDEGFHSWEEIKNEIIDYEYSGRQIHHFFSYDFDGGSEKLYLYDLRVTRYRLAKLLRVYRGRSIMQFHE